MKNSVNLNSTEWCDIIFEGKNKEYGAFALRQSSWKRHLIAFGLIVLFTAFVAALPAIISTVQAATKDKIAGIDEKRTLVDVEVKQDDKEILEPKMPEPPKFAPMTKFVPPTITTDDQASDPSEMTTMDEATKSTGFIGAFNVEGTKDPEGVFKNVATDIMGGDDGKGKGEPTIYNVGTIQVTPTFQGGEAEMYAFIKKNLNYPPVDQEMGNQGRVTIRFVVNKTGEISNVQLVKGVSPGCDKEAMRVIKSMPKWIPGRQNGEPVNVYFIIPVVFRLGN
ncbi:cell envelope biogenesis protein TonB [Bacteroidia bacterium]|nr:cell envelope biogenesis protein TonB [Bacteroidia bacterium]